MTTLCEMQFSNILWLIWGPNLGAPLKKQSLDLRYDQARMNFLSNTLFQGRNHGENLGSTSVSRLGFKWCTHGPHSGGSYVGGGGTLPKK
jgi:hypothetical protein